MAVATTTIATGCDISVVATPASGSVAVQASWWPTSDPVTVYVVPVVPGIGAPSRSHAMTGDPSAVGTVHVNVPPLYAAPSTVGRAVSADRLRAADAVLETVNATASTTAIATR